MKGCSLRMSEPKYTLENLYWHLNTAGLLCAHQNRLALSPRHLRNHALLINSKQMDFFIIIIFQKLASVPYSSSIVTCNFIFFPKLQYKYDIKWKDTFQFNIYKLILTNFNWLLSSVWTGCKWKIVGIYLQVLFPYHRYSLVRLEKYTPYPHKLEAAAMTTDFWQLQSLSTCRYQK